MTNRSLPSAEELHFAYMREKIARKQSEQVLQTKTRELYTANEQLSKINLALQQHQNATIQREKLAGLGTLVAGMAHEINNPLSFVMGNIHNLQQYVNILIGVNKQLAALDGVDSKCVQAIYTTAMEQFAWLDFDGLIRDTQDIFAETDEGLRRVKNIVTNLKNFSRKDDTGLSTYDLAVCVESALMILASEIKSRCAVELDLGAVSSMVFNPNLMTQVIINLLTNAMQALNDERPGLIHIRSWQEQRIVKLSIQDNGCGMSPDIINNIFLPFFTTKPVGMGTGLGLAICYEKVQEMGGVIEVSSQLGEGSCFTLVFNLDAQFCQLPKRA